MSRDTKRKSKGTNKRRSKSAPAKLRNKTARTKVKLPIGGSFYAEPYIPFKPGQRNLKTIRNIPVAGLGDPGVQAYKTPFRNVKPTKTQLKFLNEILGNIAVYQNKLDGSLVIAVKSPLIGRAPTYTEMGGYTPYDKSLTSNLVERNWKKQNLVNYIPRELSDLPFEFIAKNAEEIKKENKKAEHDQKKLRELIEIQQRKGLADIISRKLSAEKAEKELENKRNAVFIRIQKLKMKIDQELKRFSKAVQSWNALPLEKRIYSPEPVIPDLTSIEKEIHEHERELRHLRGVFTPPKKSPPKSKEKGSVKKWPSVITSGLSTTSRPMRASSVMKTKY